MYPCFGAEPENDVDAFVLRSILVGVKYTISIMIFEFYNVIYVTQNWKLVLDVLAAEA